MTYEFKEEAGRFVALDQQGKQAGEVTFSKQDDVLVLDHTGVEESYQGQGLAGKLVQQVVEKAKNESLKVDPVCPYAEKQFKKNEEYQEYQLKK